MEVNGYHQLFGYITAKFFKVSFVLNRRNLEQLEGVDDRIMFFV